MPRMLHVTSHLLVHFRLNIRMATRLTYKCAFRHWQGSSPRHGERITKLLTELLESPFSIPNNYIRELSQLIKHLQELLYPITNSQSIDISLSCQIHVHRKPKLKSHCLIRTQKTRVLKSPVNFTRVHNQRIHHWCPLHICELYWRRGHPRCY